MSSFQAVNVIWNAPAGPDGTNNMWVLEHCQTLFEECRIQNLSDNLPDPTKQTTNAIKMPQKSQHAHPEDLKPLEGFTDPATEDPITPLRPPNCPGPSDQGDGPAPMWIPSNNASAISMMYNRWGKGFSQDGSWGKWTNNESKTYLPGIYNAVGHLVKQSWMASDDVQSLAAFAARDAKVNCFVADSPPWSRDTPTVTARPDQKDRIRKADCLAFVTHHINHFTALFVNQVTGRSFWYDSMWRDGDATLRYAIDMDRLCKFYQSVNAAPNLIKVIRMKAGIVIGPQQPDEWTCGMHAAEFIRCCIRDNVTNIAKSPTWTKVWNDSRGNVIDHVNHFWRQWVTEEFSKPGNYGRKDLRNKPRLVLDSYDKRLRQEASSKPDQTKEDTPEFSNTFPGTFKPIKKTPSSAPQDDDLTSLFGSMRPPSDTGAPQDQPGFSTTPAPEGNVVRPSPKPDQAQDVDDEEERLSNVASTAYMKAEGQRNAYEKALFNTQEQRHKLRERRVKSITDYTRDEYVSMFENPYETVAVRQRPWQLFLRPTIAPGWEGHKRYDQGREWDAKFEEERLEAEREAARNEASGSRYSFRRR
ncbi:uncharacterized protein ColSpa_06016 [Colletotrichum spaethianum]|uniref:Uncharacterized protein n=1 Tax=Colletotrichum spaethianum TaxID=700344 RepID=A0AA37LH29_9PEZI|nr:uncharacterized protein ColSpa_06016 [Colletotrichum spaethianum]GKT45835.1 hypothetical protein ColSpa_06016 [Colletotrichum spaethianum]